MHDAANENAANGDGASAANERRLRFRESIRAVAHRSSSSDLLRWLLVPASVLLLLGFILMGLGWYGASRTAREIEQIPYLISGGMVGLALVIVGALLLASAFWAVLVRKMLEEAGQAPASTETSTDGSTPTIQSEPPAATKPRGRVARSTAAS